MQDDAQLFGPEPQARAALATMRDLQISKLRLTASWSQLTRSPDRTTVPAFDQREPGEYDQSRWLALDRAVRLAYEHGIEPMIDIAFWAPHWATESDPPGPRARTNVDPAAYGRFAAAVATRYSGAFMPPDARRALPRVRIFTVWNEPNYATFLLPQWVGGDRPAVASAAIYRGMLYAAYPAIKRANPGSIVLVGATSARGYPARRKAVPPLRFLRALACVDRRMRPLTIGRCRHYRPLPGDGWSHHPYSGTRPPDESARGAEDAPLANISRLTRALDLLAGRGRVASGLRNLWITEYGYQTRTASRPGVTAQQQAEYLPWAEDLAERNLAIKTWAQFLLRDTRPDPNGIGIERHSGLFQIDGSPKVSLAAMCLRLSDSLLSRGLFDLQQLTRCSRSRRLGAAH